MPDEKSILQRSRDLKQGYVGFWQSKYDAMDRLEEFLVGDRYEDDHGAYNRDRRLIQIRGQETQDTIRHSVARATERPRSLESRPIDNDDDPEAGEVMVSLCENEMSNPYKGFDDLNEAALTSAKEKRLGVMMMDWDPDHGAYGEIFFRYADPRRVMWDPCYEDPHHPQCPCFIEQKRMDVDTARKVYKAPWLMPDREAFDHNGNIKAGVPLIRGGSGERLPIRNQVEDNKVTLDLFWYKNDKSTKYGGTVPGTQAKVPPDERYMSCKGLCGYKSPTQSELKQQGTIQDELPEEIPGGCPTCAGDLIRIDAKEQTMEVLAYTKGHRLVIDAPHSINPDDEPVYDGSWPIKRARSFPALVYTAYQKPGDPVGPCDTDYMWDQQIALDNLRTLAVQRIAEHRTYWKQTRTGVLNSKGQRWTPRDDEDNQILIDQTQSKFGPVDVAPLNSTGLDPAFMVAFNITNAALTQYRGITDLGPTEEQKDQSGVALQTRNAIGEIPGEHFNRRKNRALSKFVGVLSDYISETYTDARKARLNIDGIDLLMGIQGDDLPGFDFVISDTPNFSGLEKARSDAFTQAMQVIAQFGIEMLDPWAEFNNVPRSVVRRIEKIFQAKKQEAEMMGALGGMTPGLVPTGTGTGDGAPFGSNGGGMVPQLGA